MAETTVCVKCGQPLDEPPGTPVEHRQPCPACGSTGRTFGPAATDPLAFSDAAAAGLTAYPDALLAVARGLIAQGHFNVAVITSHLACEVAAERAFAAAYAARDLAAVGEAVGGLMNGHNLGNDRHRKLYNALTGRQPEAEPFWPRFKAASEKRNAVVHRGGQATEAEAGAAAQAAADLVAYLCQV